MDSKEMSSCSKSDTDLTQISKSRKRKQNPDVQEIVSLREDVTKMFEDLKLDQEKKFNALNESIEEIKSYRKQLFDTNKNIETILEKTTSLYEDLKKSVQKLNTEHNEVILKINSLELKLEEVQRQQLATTIEIVNLPKQDNENLQESLNKIHNSLGLNISEKEIDHIYRINSNKKNLVIVKYENIKCRHQILKSIKEYNKSNSHNKYNTKLIDKDWEEQPIYIHESLTSNARKLHFLARGLQKNHNYKFCWITNGRVYVRQSEETPLIHIKSEQQIENLKTQSEVNLHSN